MSGDVGIKSYFATKMRELKANRIIREIDELQKELTKHQNRCKHPKVEESHGGNMGNYDPYADSCWTDYKCLTCLKTWRETTNGPF